MHHIQIAEDVQQQRRPHGPQPRLKPPTKQRQNQVNNYVSSRQNEALAAILSLPQFQFDMFLIKFTPSIITYVIKFTPSIITYVSALYEFDWALCNNFQ